MRPYFEGVCEDSSNLAGIGTSHGLVYEAANIKKTKFVSWIPFSHRLFRDLKSGAFDNKRKSRLLQQAHLREVPEV